MNEAQTSAGDGKDLRERTVHKALEPGASLESVREKNGCMTEGESPEGSWRGRQSPCSLASPTSQVGGRGLPA